MKKMVYLYTVLLLGLLLLVGCRPVAAPTGEASAVEAVEIEEVSGGTEVQSVASSVEGASIPPLASPSEDVSLIGATGRPQFLNTYADW